MRVLCSVTGAPSHGREMLPLAQALLAAGHRVLVATSDYVAPVFQQGGVPVHAVLPPMDRIARGVRAEAENHPVRDHRDEMILFAAGAHVTGIYRRLWPLAEEFSPDLVLRDGAELAALLIAEARGIPHMSAPSGVGNAIDPQGVVELLDRRRAELGLTTVAGDAGIYRHGRFDCLPPRYSLTQYAVPDAICYRQSLSLDRLDRLPASVAALPGDKPLVVAAMGTTIPMIRAMRARKDPDNTDLPAVRAALAAVVGGLSELDCAAVVATGGQDLGDIAVGPHILLCERIPQQILLRCADLFITHCGANSVREAIACGVPMAMLPQMDEQFQNADALAGFGLGARIEQTDAAAVAQACTAVLGDSRIRASAREAHREMLTLPTVSAVLNVLTEIATPHAPDYPQEETPGRNGRFTSS